MIERHVTFNVYPDKGEEFEKLFVEEYRPAMAAMPGFVRVDLLCQPEPAQPVPNGHPIRECGSCGGLAQLGGS